jgi:hypothetical protein
MLLFDARTELVAGFEPQSGISISIGNGKFASARTIQNATALLQLGAEELADLYNVPQSASGDYNKQDLHIKYGAIKYSTPGWYLSSVTSNSLSSGPYEDEASCKNDLVRVSESMAAQGVSVDQAPTWCVNYASRP